MAGADQLFSEEVGRLLDNVQRTSNRRSRICKQAPICPRCRESQVEILDSRPLAAWKCRGCKHKWRYEPLVSCKQTQDLQ